MRQTCSVELAKPLDVDHTPVASLAARRDALGEAVFIQRVPHAVDPAEAQALINDLGPGHRRAAGSLAVLSTPQVCSAFVIGLKPRPQLGGRLEKHDVLGLWHE